MTLSGYFVLKSVFGQQGCRALTFIFALARLSCFLLVVGVALFKKAKAPSFQIGSG